MFGIGGTEFVIILIFAFLIVGPEKLPDIGRTVGRAIRQFRNASDEVNRIVRTEVYDPIMDNKPLKDPTEIITGKKSGATRGVKTVDDAGAETFAERRARLARERAAVKEAKPAPVESEAAAGAEEPVQAAEEASVETFAQRRARLEAERAARAAKAQAEPEAAAPAGAQTLADSLYGISASSHGEEDGAK